MFRIALMGLGFLVLGACKGMGLGPATPWQPGVVSQPLPEEAQSCLVACPTGTTCNRRTARCEPVDVSTPVVFTFDAGR